MPQETKFKVLNFRHRSTRLCKLAKEQQVILQLAYSLRLRGTFNHFPHRFCLHCNKNMYSMSGVLYFLHWMTVLAPQGDFCLPCQGLDHILRLIRVGLIKLQSQIRKNGLRQEDNARMSTSVGSSHFLVRQKVLNLTFNSHFSIKVKCWYILNFSAFLRNVLLFSPFLRPLIRVSTQSLGCVEQKGTWSIPCFLVSYSKYLSSVSCRLRTQKPKAKYQKSSLGQFSRCQHHYCS